MPRGADKGAHNPKGSALQSPKSLFPQVRAARNSPPSSSGPKLQCGRPASSTKPTAASAPSGCTSGAPPLQTGKISGFGAGLPDLARLRFNGPVDAAELGVSLVDKLGHVLN